MAASLLVWPSLPRGNRPEHDRWGEATRKPRFGRLMLDCDPVQTGVAFKQPQPPDESRPGPGESWPEVVRSGVATRSGATPLPRVSARIAKPLYRDLFERAGQRRVGRPGWPASPASTTSPNRKRDRAASGVEQAVGPMSRMTGASGLRWVVTVETDRVGGRHTAGVATPVVTDREWHDGSTEVL